MHSLFKAEERGRKITISVDGPLFFGRRGGGGGEAGEGFGYACFLACGFRTDSRACLWVLTSFVLSPLEFPEFD